MPKILIVEDQVLIAYHIKGILNDCNYNNVVLSHKLKDATDKLTQEKADIILLDINVEGPDTGIEWAKTNVEKEKVIFITGQNEMSTLEKALDINPVAYLTKPIKSIDLLAAIQVAKKTLEPDFVIIKDGFSEIKLQYNNILFIKSDKNYIDIQTDDKKYTVRNTLDNFYKDLDSNVFCKIHRSFVINKTKVTKKNSNSILIDNFELPISRNCNLNL